MSSPAKVACPVCGFEVEEGNPWAEIAHMQDKHPEEIDRRLREAGILDASSRFSEDVTE